MDSGVQVSLSFWRALSSSLFGCLVPVPGFEPGCNFRYDHLGGGCVCQFRHTGTDGSIEAARCLTGWAASILSSLSCSLLDFDTCHQEGASHLACGEGQRLSPLRLVSPFHPRAEVQPVHQRSRGAAIHEVQQLWHLPAACERNGIGRVSEMGRLTRKPPSGAPPHRQESAHLGTALVESGPRGRLAPKRIASGPYQN